MAKEKLPSKRYEKAYFKACWGLIRFMALGNETDRIVHLSKSQNQDVNEETVRFLISRIESDYMDLVQIMEAICFAKFQDFVKMGATKEQANDCLRDWLKYELF